MSGSSYNNLCPNCQESMQCFSDYKPFDTVGGECLNCGFYYNTQANQMKLNELNDSRIMFNEDNGFGKGDKEYLPSLKKLPKCDLSKIY
jgi:hypothetical protein